MTLQVSYARVIMLLIQRRVSRAPRSQRDDPSGGRTSSEESCGAKIKEPMELPAERPARFERLCLRALSEGVISEAKAAELMRMSVHMLQKFLDQTPEGEANSGHPRP
jgi:hypothetical protein